MKNKKIIVWVLIILGIFSLLWLTGKNKASNQNKINTNIGNKLTETATFYDFGTISMKNGKVTKVFSVTNKTDKDILFPELTTSCMCTAAYFVQPDGSKKGPFGMPGMGMVPKLNETIKAGKEASIEVVYDPNAHGPAGVGMIDRFVYLVDDSGETTQFEIKANVTP